MEKIVYTHDEIDPNTLLWIPPHLRNFTWAIFENGKMKCSQQPCSFLIQSTFPSNVFAQSEGPQDRVYGLSLSPGCEARVIED